MNFKPNIGKAHRIAYVVLGLVMVGIPFATDLEGWARTVVPILGGVTMVAGGVGL